MKIDDNFYMKLAIDEAWKYQLLTYPNPAVGCVVVVVVIGGDQIVWPAEEDDQPIHGHGHDDNQDQRQEGNTHMPRSGRGWLHPMTEAAQY